ncbi:centromere protein C-like [Stegostoma tigrinum]|uniref:centromere protein C-like n=1 Tax=Stegostoma tigrinum TaxID=3053191 RepID=UPI0028707347|nr:centromere protein C-like [Stegostoma tigrinum]
MNGDGVLPRLELPKQPYRSRYYRDNTLGRLPRKPVTTISQKNINTSTILNNFLAGLDSINNSGSHLDSTSRFEVQLPKEKNLVKQSPADLQGNKTLTTARAPLQVPENNQPHEDSCTGKRKENNGYCSSSKQTQLWLVQATVANNKANEVGGGDNVVDDDDDDERGSVDEAEEHHFVTLKTLELETDVSPVGKHGITYNAETSVINSTPNDSALPLESKPNMRLCFDTSITPVVARSPLAALTKKNIAQSTSGVERHKVLSDHFGKKPAVVFVLPPSAVPSTSTPEPNDFETELMEKESFCFESQIIIPRKTQVLSQKPEMREKKSNSNKREVIKKGKHKTAGKKSYIDEKQAHLLTEPVHLKQLEDKETCKLNEPVRKSTVLPLKKNYEEQLHESLSTSIVLLSPKQRTEFGPKKQKSGKKYVTIEDNRDAPAAFQEEPRLHVTEKANVQQSAINAKNSAKSNSLTSLPKAGASNDKTPKQILCTESETPNKKKAVNQPRSSGKASLSKHVDPLSMPENVADDQECGRLAGLETNKPNISLFEGKNKEKTVMNAFQTLAILPQRIISCGQTLNASETPAVLNSECVTNKQRDCPADCAVSSTSLTEKQRNEQTRQFLNTFGIKPAVSVLPQPKQDIRTGTAPVHEFEFELEEEESFCFESWITIPKKAINQNPAEQEKKSASPARKTKKARIQKTEPKRKVAIHLKNKIDEKQFKNKNKQSNNENQPKYSGKRSTRRLKNNKIVVNSEREEQEIQNVSVSQCERLPSPKLKKERKKRGRIREKSIGKSGRVEGLEDLCVKHNENRNDTSCLAEQDETPSKRLLKSENSVNLPGFRIYEKKSDQTLSANSQIQSRKKMKKRQGQKPTVRKKEISAKETRPKKPDHSKKCYPSRGFEENHLRDDAVDVCTRSQRIVRPPPKWWVVQHADNRLQDRLKADYLTELDSSLLDQTAKPSKSQMKKKKKKKMDLKIRCSRAQTKNIIHSSEVQNVSEDIFECDFSPTSSPHRHSKHTKQQRAADKCSNSLVRPQDYQSKPTGQQEITNSVRPSRRQSKLSGYQDTAYQQDTDSDSVSIKKQSRKQKHSSVPFVPKKRLFSEVEEEKQGKSLDMRLPNKRKSTQKLKSHYFDMQNENEIEEEEEYSSCPKQGYVCTTSRKTEGYISASSKSTSQKSSQGSVASFTATYLDKKSPQRHLDSCRSPGTHNQVLTSPRRSITKSVDELAARPQVSTVTPYQAVMSPRSYNTTKYQDKTAPPQHSERPTGMIEEDDKPEPSSSVQSKRAVRQGPLHNDLPVFNKSGPGPCANYEEESADPGDHEDFEHREIMDFDASDDDSYMKGSTSEENDNCEKRPPEIAMQERLKPTCVWDVKESSEAFVDCVKTSDMCDFFYPLKTMYEDNRSIAICKSLNSQTFSCGKLVLGPYKEKGCQMVYKDTMVFHILKGDLGVTIYRTTYHLKEGDYFFVPSGNTYNVTNLQDTEAVLLFTQLKGSKMD